MRSSRAATGSSDLGIAREAPFGVPVVPEVRMIALPSVAGATTDERSPWATRSASVGAPGGGGVARRRVAGRRAGLVPGDVALAPAPRLPQHRGELLVVDERL